MILPKPKGLPMTLTVPRVSVAAPPAPPTLEEKHTDLAAHLLMLIMTIDQQNVTPEVQSVVEKAREALKRSGK